MIGEPESPMHDNLLGVFDNIPLLRYVELHRSHRPRSSVKMRESEYVSAILSERPRLVATPRTGDDDDDGATTAPLVTPVR
jgi:hypothetical protein